MYNVSKQSMVALSESLYNDLRLVTDQVSASVLCPFFIPTNISKKESSPIAAQEDDSLTASQKVGKAFMTKAVASGKLTAEQLADMVFDALDKDIFYIYSHPGSLETFKSRADDILQQRNPTDPYISKPEFGVQLSSSLRKAYGFKE